MGSGTQQKYCLQCDSTGDCFEAEQEIIIFQLIIVKGTVFDQTVLGNSVFRVSTFAFMCAREKTARCYMLCFSVTSIFDCSSFSSQTSSPPSLCTGEWIWATLDPHFLSFKKNKILHSQMPACIQTKMAQLNTVQH